MFDFTFETEPWMQEARCYTDQAYFGYGLPPSDFFSDKGIFVDEAKEFCKGCPVRETCLSYAISNDIDEEIFGGVTGRERRRIRNKARKAVLMFLEQQKTQLQDDTDPIAS